MSFTLCQQKRQKTLNTFQFIIFNLKKLKRSFNCLNTRFKYLITPCEVFKTPYLNMVSARWPSILMQSQKYIHIDLRWSSAICQSHKLYNWVTRSASVKFTITLFHCHKKTIISQSHNLILMLIIQEILHIANM